MILEHSKKPWKNVNSDKWMNAMKEELESMATNEVWDIIELPKGSKAVGCKWVFKTKRDSKGKVERFKARLMAKGFTQRDELTTMRLTLRYPKRIHLG